MTASDRYSDGTYLASNPTWGEEEAPWKAELVLAMLAEHGLEPKTVFEIGSGSGRMLQEIHRQLPEGAELRGYDVSAAAHERAMGKSTDGLSFFNGDLQSINTDEIYDLGLAIDVFEHVENFFEFLRFVRAHSRHQIFHIPLDISVQTVLRETPFAFRRATVGHIHFFTKETALATLEDCGYEILATSYTSKSMNLTTKARIARQLRKAPFALAPDLTVRILGGYSLLVLSQ